MFRPQEKRRIIKIWPTLGLVVVLGGVIYLLFFTSIFEIKKVNMEGSYIFSEEEAKNLIGGAKYIFSSIELGEWPIEVKEVSYERSYLKREVLLKVEEREHYGMWCFSEKCWWFDKQGVIFKEAPLTRGNFIKVIYGDREIRRGEKIVKEELFINLADILSILERVNLEVDRFEIEDIKNEEMIAYSKGVPIYFSLRINPIFTEKALNSLKEELGKISYVDLRSENRAFYKYK